MIIEKRTCCQLTISSMTQILTIDFTTTIYKVITSPDCVYLRRKTKTGAGDPHSLIDELIF